MTTETESLALIQKAEKQKHTIIDEISNRPSENLLVIRDWIKKIDLKSPSINISLITTFIDRTFFYITNKFNTEKAGFIEKVLLNLIKNWHNLQEQKIFDNLSSLKAYAKNNDANSDTELKKSLAPVFKDIFPRQKKKLKPRIIEFDEEGKGYEFFNWYRCFLDNINLEIVYPKKIKRKLLQEKLFKQELECLGKIEIDEESYLNNLKRKIKIYEYDLFVDKEDEDARQRNIEQKIENTKKDRNRQKISKLFLPDKLRILKTIEIYKKTFVSQSVNIKLPFFEASKDSLLTAFLKTVDYEKFQQLIRFSKHILISINKIRETLEKIDKFSEDLGVFSDYVRFLDDCYRKIKENFSRENIGKFLESALILFEQKTLAFDNKYCLLNIQAKKQKEIVFSKLVFLDDFISNNNAQQVFKLLSDDISTFFQVNLDSALIRNSYLEKNTNMLKKLLNYFTGNYYFCNQSHKDKFVKIFLLNFQEEFTFEFIRNKITKLKWWNFIFSGISPARVFEKGFNERLSEKLYLKLLEEKFKKITEKPVPNVENIDKLYGIKKDINFFKNKIQDHSINLNSLNVLDSRQSIVDRLKKHEEIKKLLDNILILSNQAESCINEFNYLKIACSTESGKVSENGEIVDLNNVSKLHFSLKWWR
ncbi:hypothetical protein [Rickettsiella endosymbiont of Xylota segnis]|uniref:hypothetical protein n=1 Tax=Rickettsiella endosymbiont of Xylota segnis TaxID=3066238 RepID=UPI0030D3AFE4